MVNRRSQGSTYIPSLTLCRVMTPPCGALMGMPGFHSCLPMNYMSGDLRGCRSRSVLDDGKQFDPVDQDLVFQGPALAIG